jgi:hypothetical protein
LNALIERLAGDLNQIDIQIQKLQEQYLQSSVKASAVKISDVPIEFNHQLTMELNEFDVEIDRFLPSLGLFGPIRMLLEKINIDKLVALTEGKVNILVKYRTFVENELQHLPKSKKKKWRDILISIGVELEPLANRLLSLQELQTAILHKSVNEDFLDHIDSGYREPVEFARDVSILSKGSISAFEDLKSEIERGVDYTRREREKGKYTPIKESIQIYKRNIDFSNMNINKVKSLLDQLESKRGSGDKRVEKIILECEELNSLIEKEFLEDTHKYKELTEEYERELRQMPSKLANTPHREVVNQFRPSEKFLILEIHNYEINT